MRRNDYDHGNRNQRRMDAISRIALSDENVFLSEFSQFTIDSKHQAHQPRDRDGRSGVGRGRRARDDRRGGGGGGGGGEKWAR